MSEHDSLSDTVSYERPDYNELKKKRKQPAISTAPQSSKKTVSASQAVAPPPKPKPVEHVTLFAENVTTGTTAIPSPAPYKTLKTTLSIPNISSLHKP